MLHRHSPSKSLLPSGGPSELRSLLRRLLGAQEPRRDGDAGEADSLLVPNEYEFSRTQERAFVELDSAMTRCAARYLLLACACAAAAAAGAGSHRGPSAPLPQGPPGCLLPPCPHTWTARAEAAQALAVSVFLWAAGEPFALIAETRGRDLSHLMDGLSETAHALFEASEKSREGVRRRKKVSWKKVKKTHFPLFSLSLSLSKIKNKTGDDHVLRPLPALRGLCGGTVAAWGLPGDRGDDVRGDGGEGDASPVRSLFLPGFSPSFFFLALSHPPPSLSLQNEKNKTATLEPSLLSSRPQAWQ